MAPVVARDTQILDRLLPRPDDTRASQNPDNVSQRPVYHVTIPPRRPSPTHCGCLQTLSARFLKTVEPFWNDLFELYFSKLHVCLPILDANETKAQLATAHQYPQTLITNFVAYTLFYWDSSESLKGCARPSQELAWQVACSVMSADLQRTGFPSVQAAILNIAGRPSEGVVHNTTNVARAVALSHSLGLNHDCSDWKLTAVEKAVRCKLWWAVLVHDRWFHFAQGTPPLINAAHYDVSLPEISGVLSETTGNEEARRGAQCYIALCRLTEIVGDVLPLIYHIRSGTASMTVEQRKKSQQDLDLWEQSLPEFISLKRLEHRPPIPGLVNLQLSYLAAQMLLQRLAWYEQSHKSVTSSDESYLDDCQRVAEDVARFAASLTERELAGFWLPYNVQHFASANTLLLRCALQTGVSATRAQCLGLSRNLVSNLRKQRSQYNWDLAEIALRDSEKTLEQVEAALPVLFQVSQRAEGGGIIVNAAHAEEGTGSGLSDTGRGDVTSIDLDGIFADELFPELFASFTDYSLFDQPLPWHDRI